MLTWVARQLFGTANDRAVKRLKGKVERINALEDQMKKLSDAELQAKTNEFKEKLDNGASLDDILVEAFAVCRDASRRVLRMRHYDVQLMGGMVLHQGSIAEMKTGEGKTLVATLPIYLNALEGKGVHLITVNDYLAKRDAEWMGRLYNWLGLSIGTIVNQQGDAEKRKAYRCDICYGQNNEFGFDYLRDNMKFSALDYAQRPLNYAIVDEVDSILIDEARTPLIISGPAEAASEKYRSLNEIMPKLRKDEHYIVDEKGFGVTLTDDGVELVQKLIGISNLYEPVHVRTLHILNQLLRAHALYKRDVHYMVSPDGKVLIIDEFTGRVLAGRRWSDGLHQAVEAKENVRIQEESRTMASITFQNLFRIYKKLAGMTGTAQTEAQEFHSTYKLDVTAIPTNRGVSRHDDEDVVYKTEREKFTALIRDIMEKHEQGRPVLVGTTSVEKSAAIARILGKKKVPHNVLNAKHHENEAYIVAQAGRLGGITVSTNMAGRGTDILLGGNPEMLARLEFREANRLPEAEPKEFEGVVAKFEASCKIEHDKVVELGGLHIVGTERHESRRIDNQLRGRAGRQGDPGSSRFYLSLEDDLMRIFAGDRVKNLMDRMGMPDDEPIEHPWVTKSVENAQRKVEMRNFDIRKNLLEFDDVMNAQRKTMYSLRQQLLIGRYSPEELDELGKSTGRFRMLPINEEMQTTSTRLVGQLLGMFAEPAVQMKKVDGKNVYPERADFEKVEKIADHEALQREVYHLWGVRLDVGERIRRTPVQFFDELTELVARGLTEQRERLLDLMDKIISAMVEESCPENRPPEDWDWPGIHAGFKEHFGAVLPPDVDALGEATRIAAEVFRAAEAIYVAKEKEFGVENILRVFRHFYLEEIDRSWVDHLSSMEHLRDGIHLRGYGQRDPKQEYKKEGFNFFVNMMARVSSNVLTKLFQVEAEKNDIEAMEEEAAKRHLADLEKAVARHVGEETEQAKKAAAAPAAKATPKTSKPPANPAVRSSDPCPCGSGRKFRECHGAALDDDAA
ncbi:MAG TPA: preprotein translocase subunit SecA [Polyangiaceae bacterium]|jgi:preprotein translocase subunit SecA|nr:preprotein translocase subunit SecA [Polyangiaceae bacterium]